MTIETYLERIAVSLETLVKAATPQQPANETPTPTPTPTPTRGRPKKAAAEKAPEPAPEPSEGSLDADPPAEAEAASGGFDDDAADSVVEDVPSKEDMIAKLTELGSVIGTDKARELMAKYGDGAKKASDVPESKRAEVIKQAAEAKAKAAKAKK